MKTMKPNRAFMHNNIPYVNCYEKGGMIETQLGEYGSCWKVILPSEATAGNLILQKVKMVMENILTTVTKGCEYEFTLLNRIRDETESKNSIMLESYGNEEYAAEIALYNNLLQENYEIGHNNFKSELYLICKRKADSPEQALEFFDGAEQVLQELFHSLYGCGLKRLTLVERLELLYDIYHPESTAPKFGSKADYDGKGFSIKSMERMKMTTKDVVMPDRYECTERTYMKVGNLHARTFFLGYIPKMLSENILLDISAVSSQSIISVYGQSLDEDLGSQVAAKLVQDNTEVKNIPVRDTVSDRKNHRVERQERNIRENEDEFFYQSALDLFKESKAKEHSVIQSTILITLFAETLEELERDSKLLYMSAGKYACQIRCLDLQQNEGFQSVLPLCNMRVNVPRVFSLEQMVMMQPLRIQDIFERNRTYYGLNAINDNLVLMDRGNYPIALITGIKNSGKTISVKRSAANTLLSTRDDVVILTADMQSYRNFVEKLHGHMMWEFQPDIFEKDANYNLNQDKRHLVKIFLEAYLNYKVGGDYLRGATDFGEQVEREAHVLSQCSNLEEALQYAKEHPIEVPLYIKSLEDFSFSQAQFTMSKRLAVVGFDSEVELLAKLDAIWNYAVQSKKRNRTVWIYVDAADPLVNTTAGNNYLISILERAEILKVPVTLVIEDAVHIVSNQKSMIEFDYLLDRVSCFKLLSIGPLERKVFIERLNISQQMLPYFVDRGPGEGILVTPSATIAFNDRFEATENEFFHLFQ